MKDFNSRKAVKAIQKTVYFGLNQSVEAFLILDTEEIRYSQSSVSLLLGYRKDWLYNLRSESPRKLKDMQGRGLTGSFLSVSVARPGQRGATQAKTLSGSDFDIVLEVEAKYGNQRAISLLSGGWRQFRIDQSREAFDLEERGQDEKLRDFDDWVFSSQSDRFDREQLWDMLGEERLDPDDF